MAEQILLEIGGRKLNIGSRQCSINGKSIALTPTECSILRILCQEKGSPVSAKELFQRIWGEDYYYGSDGTISVRICHLREKIGAPMGSRKCIKTVRGVGYKIEA